MFALVVCHQLDVTVLAGGGSLAVGKGPFAGWLLFVRGGVSEE